MYGRPATSTRAGFTLVELLVVLFLVAVLAGLVVMQLGDRGEHRELRREAERLQHLIELGRQEAVRSASQWGIQFDRRGYRFLKLDPERRRWEPVIQRPWGERSLPDSMQLRVRAEGRAAARGLEGSTEDSRRPSILLLSSSEVSPFEVRLTDTRIPGRWHLSSDGFKRTRLRAADPG